MLYIYVLAAFGATFLGFIISVYIFTGKSKKSEEPIEDCRRQRNRNDEDSHKYETEKGLEHIPTVIDSNMSFDNTNMLDCNDVLSFTDIYSAVTNQNMNNTVQGQHLKEQSSYKLINRKLKNEK